MVRIGRQIPHFEEVDLQTIDAVFSEDKRFRYILEMQFRPSLLNGKRNKRAVVIMKNPSAADARAADATIRKVETYVYHRLEDVKYLTILNLFALRATEAKDLNIEFERTTAMEVIGPGNDTAIRQTVESSDYLLVASGSGLLTGGISSSAGVSPAATEEVYVAPYNDLAAVQEILKANGDEIAAVIVEPIAGNMGLVEPAPGFLEGLREATAESGKIGRAHV